MAFDFLRSSRTYCLSLVPLRGEEGPQWAGLPVLEMFSLLQYQLQDQRACDYHDSPQGSLIPRQTEESVWPVWLSLQGVVQARGSEVAVLKMARRKGGRVDVGGEPQ